MRQIAVTPILLSLLVAPLTARAQSLEESRTAVSALPADSTPILPSAAVGRAPDDVDPIPLHERVGAAAISAPVVAGAFWVMYTVLAAVNPLADPWEYKKVRRAFTVLGAVMGMAHGWRCGYDTEGTRCPAP